MREIQNFEYLENKKGFSMKSKAFLLCFKGYHLLIKKIAGKRFNDFKKQERYKPNQLIGSTKEICQFYFVLGVTKTPKYCNVQI